MVIHHINIFHKNFDYSDMKKQHKRKYFHLAKINKNKSPYFFHMKKHISLDIHSIFSYRETRKIYSTRKKNNIIPESMIYK